MGLGKTIEILSLLSIKSSKNLIICPKILIKKWEYEILTHTNY